MKPIRLATPEEIQSIESFADLHDGCTVLAFGDGEDIDFAVIRNVIEIDPLVSASNNNPKRKALFVWALENMLRFTGVKRYYFNIAPDEQTWKETVEKWGAKQISEIPEIRFRKEL